MRKIAVFNQKGGVGKTTTAVNLGAGLSRNGKRTVIIDLDPQGDISVCHDVKAEKSLHELIMGEAELEETITRLGKNLDIIHSNNKLAESEQSIIERKKVSDIFESIFTPKLDYDYVILDCPPSLRSLNKSALFYAREVVIPAATDILGYDALIKTISTIVKLNGEHKRKLYISCIIPTMYDKRRKMCTEILKKMKSEFTPMIVSEPIRFCSKLGEAPNVKKSIFNFAKSSSGAEDYWKVVKLMLENENMYDTRFTFAQRERAMHEYYVEGKKRELMMVGDKITFGFRFLTKMENIGKSQSISKILPFDLEKVYLNGKVGRGF